MYNFHIKYQNYTPRKKSRAMTIKTKTALNEKSLNKTTMLSSKNSKNEIIDDALQNLGNALKKQVKNKHDPIAQSIKVDNFTPLSRNEIYNR